MITPAANQVLQSGLLQRARGSLLASLISRALCRSIRAQGAAVVWGTSRCGPPDWVPMAPCPHGSVSPWHRVTVLGAVGCRWSQRALGAPIAGGSVPNLYPHCWGLRGARSTKTALFLPPALRVLWFPSCTSCAGPVAVVGRAAHQHRAVLEAVGSAGRSRVGTAGCHLGALCAVGLLVPGGDGWRTMLCPSCESWLRC